MAEPTPEAVPTGPVPAGPGPSAPSGPSGPDGGPATPPRVAPWLLLYTFGRLAIVAALVAVLWVAGLGSYAGLLFGVLLSMPIAYLVLRPVRDRLAEALAARSVARRAAKEDLRARLSGEGPAA
ncbi:DUF4229 domain-containing protein [Geodermatophilus sp. SYSU D00815]